MRVRELQETTEVARRVPRELRREHVPRDAYVDAAATGWCPEPGCPQRLVQDLESPNVLRCAKHGSTMIATDRFDVPPPPRPPESRPKPS